MAIAQKFRRECADSEANPRQQKSLKGPLSRSCGPASRRLNIVPMVETVITIRTARLGDEDDIAAVHDAAWRDAYRGVIPGRELERMVARRGPKWWQSAIRRGTRLAVLDFDESI